jgi:hypothetical protein
MFRAEQNMPIWRIGILRRKNAEDMEAEGSRELKAHEAASRSYRASEKIYFHGQTMSRSSGVARSTEFQHSASCSTSAAHVCGTARDGIVISKRSHPRLTSAQRKISDR